MRVAIYSLKRSGRTRHIARAMQEGFRRQGVATRMVTTGKGICADMAIAYGWNHEPIFSRYRKAGLPYVYFDLGYWDRRPHRQPREGYHRLSVNDWCSSKHMLRGMPADRFNLLKMDVKPWGSTGKPVLLTGMSGKAAGTHGFKPGEWERGAQDMIKALTNRALIYRPKPTKRARALDPIETVLQRSHMLVTHHSNTAVDALVNGIPYYCVKGVARFLSPAELTTENIEHPVVVGDADRQQLLNDIAYCQFTPEEMRQGVVWEHIKCILGSV